MPDQWDKQAKMVPGAFRVKTASQVQREVPGLQEPLDQADLQG